MGDMSINCRQMTVELACSNVFLLAVFHKLIKKAIIAVRLGLKTSAIILLSAIFLT